MIISIQEVSYKGDYKINFQFSDGVERTVDFEEFLRKSKNPMTNKYLNKELFKAFTLDYGDIVWNNYELCFPVWDLHKGEI
ncbi:MAG: DUF2442 domain-containing protein [Bacteroidetes bacterium]|nr:DUF2442 domain-containing protein [Bacteroidota bacterium]